MGQYHFVVNLDKKEFIHPHKLGTGLKLWEQLANSPGTGAALIVLLASASNGQGGGDLRTESDIIGSWRGCKIAMVGDYDDDSIYYVSNPLKKMSGAQIYEACSSGQWSDVSDVVCAVIEKELSGKYCGGGWRTFEPIESEQDRALKKALGVPS
mgnify:CR=1 FL=1